MPSSHQLADIEGSDAVWLSDYQYEAGSFLQWNKLKDFLEGESMKVAVPKHQGKNYLFTLDSPVFGTAPCPVRHPSKQAETDQMHSRIQYFIFSHYFDPSTCPDIKPCACFLCPMVVASISSASVPAAALATAFGTVTTTGDCTPWVGCWEVSRIIFPRRFTKAVLSMWSY